MLARGHANALGEQVGRAHAQGHLACAGAKEATGAQACANAPAQTAQQDAFEVEAFEVAGEVASFFSNLVGGDDVSFDIKGGTTTDNATTGVTVDGKV